MVPPCVAVVVAAVAVAETSTFVAFVVGFDKLAVDLEAFLDLDHRRHHSESSSRSLAPGHVAELESFVAAAVAGSRRHHHRRTIAGFAAPSEHCLVVAGPSSTGKSHK